MVAWSIFELPVQRRDRRPDLVGRLPFIAGDKMGAYQFEAQGLDLASRDVAAEHLADGRHKTVLFRHCLLPVGGSLINSAPSLARLVAGGQRSNFKIERGLESAL